MMAGLLSWRRDRSASLFERIQGNDVGFSRHARNHDLLVSIKNNLNQVLNTHPGNSQSAPALGVVDMNDATASTSDFRLAVEHAISRCIEDYEPRIAHVQVHAGLTDNTDPLTLTFNILAHVNFDDVNDVIEFNIYLDNHQRYHLS